MKHLLATLVCLLWAVPCLHAQLLSEDFGTTFSTTQLGFPEWASCRTTSSNSSLGPCASVGDYGGSISNNQNLTTESITIPSTGYCLTFDYSYNSGLNLPRVQIGTGGAFCWSGTTVYTDLATLTTTATCDVASFSLDAYAGQTIFIRFLAGNSFTSWYLDDILVDLGSCSGGGGGGCTNIVFSDDFADGSIGAPEWTTVNAAFTSTGTPCNGGNSRVWFSTFSSPAQAVSRAIDLSGATTAEISLDYYMAAAAFSFQCAYIEISTNNGISWNDVTPTYTDPDGSCQSASTDISAYVGGNVNIRIRRSSTTQTFYFDNVSVCTDGGGGAGVSYKWADNFNDNDLTLDFTGNDGDEDCASCGPWVLGGGSSLVLVPAGGWNGSSNETEAFPASMANVYYARLDPTEYIESPVMDMSNATGFKISFHAKSSSPGTGGGDQWSFSDRLRLQIWDGSAWITVQSMRDDLSPTWNGIDDYISAGLPLNYYCFTAYRENTSPGNYYYNSTPNVNSAYFHSGFKFRVIYEGNAARTAFAWVDDFTFRADNDGYSTMIPCGVSFWNEPAATGYGQDPGTTGNNNAEKGVELELDNSINIPPVWTTEADDGDTITQTFGPGEAERVVFCCISEHEINFAYPVVNFYAPSMGNQSSVMSIDPNYTGPGWKYYAVEYISCDLAGGSIAEPTNDFQYHFYFDYGLSGFIPVYYHLNTSGIQVGGGATSVFERFNAPDVISSDGCGVLPHEWLDLSGDWAGTDAQLFWETQAERQLEHFVIQRETPTGDWEIIGNIQATAAEGQGARYSFVDEAALYLPPSQLSYRVVQWDLTGKTVTSEVITLEKPVRATALEIFPNPNSGQAWVVWHAEAGVNAQLEVLNLVGQTVWSSSWEMGQGPNKKALELGHLPSGLYYLRLKLPTQSVQVRLLRN